MSSNNHKIIIHIPIGDYELGSAQLEEMENVRKVLKYIFGRNAVYQGGTINDNK